MKKIQCKSIELNKNLETLCDKTKNILVLGKVGSGKSYGAINFLKKMNSSNPDFSLKAGYFVCDDGGASYFSTKAFKNLWKDPVNGEENSAMYEATVAGNPIVIDNVDRSFLTSSYFLDFLRLISKEKNRGTLILVADGESMSQNDVPTEIKNDCVAVEVTDNNHRKTTESIMKKYTIKNYKGNIVESLSRFQKKYPGMKICEAIEENKELKIKVKESSNTFDDDIRNEILKVFGNNIESKEDYSDDSLIVNTKNLNPTEIGYIRDDLKDLLDKYSNLSWDEDNGDNGFYSRRYEFYFVKD